VSSLSCGQDRGAASQRKRMIKELAERAGEGEAKSSQYDDSIRSRARLEWAFCSTLSFVTFLRPGPGRRLTAETDDQRIGRARRGGRGQVEPVRRLAQDSHGIDRRDRKGDLAYTRYSFTRLCVCKYQLSLYYPRPFALPTLLQYVCATFVKYMIPPRPFL